MKRIFIAIKIELNPDFEVILSQLKKELKEERIRWVADENQHLTLQFLGDLNEAQISKIIKALGSLTAETSSFSFLLKRLSYFGKRKNPAVVFIGIKEADQLNCFVEKLQRSLEEFGFEGMQRKYSPHLTLGRMKFIKNKTHFFATLEKFSNNEQQTIQVKEIILYESILKPTEPEYRVLQKFSLH